MNLNLINKYCDEWTREDWVEAYAQHCANPFDKVMTKREYYDFVRERHSRLKLAEQPLSDELKRKWTIGKRNARLWAKKHGCDMNGRLLSVVELEKRNADALAMAERAEETAVGTMQRLDYLIEKVRAK